MMPIFAENISFVSHEIEHRNDLRWLLSPAPRAWLVLRNLFDTGLRPGVNEVSHFQAFDESQGSPEQVATAFTQLLPAWRNVIEVLN